MDSLSTGTYTVAHKPALPPLQLSATIAAEFSTARNRGALVASVFAMQGIGILFASIVAVCTTAAFKNLILKDIAYLDYVWRIELGLGVVPALLTVYLRKKLPETLHWTIDVAGDVAQAAADADAIGSTRPRPKEVEATGGELALTGAHNSSLSARVRHPAVTPLEKHNGELKYSVGAAAERESAEKLKDGLNDGGGSAEKFKDSLYDGGAAAIGLKEYLTSPSIAKNRNFSILVGTCMCWFLLSVSFFSQNLFLPDVLQRSATHLFLFCCLFVFCFFASLLVPSLSSLTFHFPSSFSRTLQLDSQSRFSFPRETRAHRDTAWDRAPRKSSTPSTARQLATPSSRPSVPCLDTGSLSRSSTGGVAYRSSTWGLP